MELKTLIAYLAKHSDIKGKKALQKLVYFCSENGVPVNCSYRMYLYGPYSNEVAGEVEELIASEILNVKPDNYTFTKGMACDDYYNSYGWEIKDYRDDINNVLEKFSGFSPLKLELYATVHFIANIKKQISGTVRNSEVIEEVRQAKGSKFDIQEIEEAYNNLVDWQMIFASNHGDGPAGCNG